MLLVMVYTLLKMYGPVIDAYTVNQNRNNVIELFAYYVTESKVL